MFLVNLEHNDRWCFLMFLVNLKRNKLKNHDKY